MHITEIKDLSLQMIVRPHMWWLPYTRFLMENANLNQHHSLFSERVWSIENIEQLGSLFIIIMHRPHN